MKQSVTVDAQLLWGGRYCCNNGCYGCTIVMSYIEINKAVSQWLLTFNLCVSLTWPLTCAFHIPCTHTPEIIDMHRGVCDNLASQCTWLTCFVSDNVYCYIRSNLILSCKVFSRQIYRKPRKMIGYYFPVVCVCRATQTHWNSRTMIIEGFEVFGVLSLNISRYGICHVFCVIFLIWTREFCKSILAFKSQLMLVKKSKLYSLWS